MKFKNHVSKSILFIFIIFLLGGTIGCSDEDGNSSVEESGLCLVEVDGIFVDIELDKIPEYLNGGNSGFSEEIFMILKYPAEARENSIEGDCIVNYEITKDGTVENVLVVQDPGGGIGDAVFEVLTTITEGISFSPGILNDSPVRVKKDLLIKFKLEG